MREDAPVVDEGLAYRADGRRIGLHRRTDLIAVALRRPVVAVDAGPADLLTRATASDGALAGFAVHQVGPDGLVLLQHAGAAQEKTPEGRARWGARLREAVATARTLTGVAWAAPVFVNAESGTLQVATNEVIVALRRPVDAAAFFSGDRRFTAVRPLSGTDDQFVATVADGAGEAAILLANRLHDDARVVWASPNFVQQFSR